MDQVPSRHHIAFCSHITIAMSLFLMAKLFRTNFQVQKVGFSSQFLYQILVC